MLDNKYKDKRKDDVKKRIIIIIVAIITLLLTLLILKSCFSNEIKANEESISELDIDNYQTQIDELANIELIDDNKEEIQRRIIKIKELLDIIPDEYEEYLDLSSYEELLDYIDGLIDTDSNNEQYKIDVLSNNKSLGSVSGGGVYKKNEEITIQAKPNGNYYFIKWDDGNIENPRKITVIEDKTYTAIFSMMCTIKTASSDSSKGTTSGDGEYLLGTRVTLTAHPKDCYEFNGWSDGNNDNPRTIVVDKSQTYVASFCLEDSDSYISVNDPKAGSVTGGDDIEIDKTVTLTAVAKKGYRFVRWSDGNTDNPRRVKIKANTKYEAIFEAIIYQIKWDARGIATLSFTSSTATVKTGIKELPEVNCCGEYKFIGWYTNSSDYNHTGGRKITSSSIPDGDETYYAVFAKKQTVYRASYATGQSETMKYEPISGSSCWVPDYPEYYVSVSVDESYTAKEANAKVCGVNTSYKYECSDHKAHDGMSWEPNCQPNGCYCGNVRYDSPKTCNVTHTIICPGYYEITGWTDWNKWTTEYIDNITNSESYSGIVKVESEEKYLYDDSLFYE